MSTIIVYDLSKKYTTIIRTLRTSDIVSLQIGIEELEEYVHGLKNKPTITT